MWSTILVALPFSLVTMELLDPREVNYWDSVDLVGRIGGLATAPHLGALDRFPSVDYLQRRREYLYGLMTLAAAGGKERLYHADQYRAWYLCCRWANEVVGELHDARRTEFYVTIRREALQRARALMGADAFEEGWFP